MSEGPPFPSRRSRGGGKGEERVPLGRRYRPFAPAARRLHFRLA